MPSSGLSAIRYDLDHMAVSIWLFCIICLLQVNLPHQFSPICVREILKAPTGSLAEVLEK
jgi:hypothetical protein